MGRETSKIKRLRITFIHTLYRHALVHNQLRTLVYLIYTRSNTHLPYTPRYTAHARARDYHQRHRHQHHAQLANQHCMESREHC